MLVLLGSATPSLAVYRRARQDEILYLPLTGRVFEAEGGIIGIAEGYNHGPRRDKPHETCQPDHCPHHTCYTRPAISRSQNGDGFKALRVKWLTVS